MNESSPPRARLVDYFVDVTADILSVPKTRASSEDVDEFDRRITHRIPTADHADFPLPDGVPLFCIPSCLSAVTPSAYERKPTFFSFSLTGGDGARAYGFALHFYDQQPATQSPAAADEPASSSPSSRSWRPRVFCLISHHPFFSLFKEVVSWVYRQRTHSSEQQVVEAILADASDQRSWFVSPRGVKQGFDPDNHQNARHLSRAMSEGARPTISTLSLEPESHNDHNESENTPKEDRVNRLLEQLVAHAACPCPGGVLELRLDGYPFFRYHVQRGNVTHLDDYCFQVLFQCLSLKNVIYIVNCILLEQRILIHSNHHGLLTPVCEALCALLFPFAWEHVYVPFLPVKLIEYLQAPVPYIMGLHTSALATRVGAEIFSSCVVVHLDKDKVVTPISSRIDDSPIDFVLARLPSNEVDTLLRSVEHLVPQPVNSTGLYSHSNRTPRSASNVLGSPTSLLPHVVESLSFSSTPLKSPENEVELTFGEGPLGITFESTHMRMLAVNHFQPGRQPSSSAVVKALPRLQNGLPGPAERSGLIRAGSFLVGINGLSTLDLTFEETIDRLRVEKRPVRLRFINAPAPHEGASRFAERPQALSLVSALQVDTSNTLHRWVETVRSSFAVLFTSIFRDFQRFILIEHIVSSPSSPSSLSPAAHRPPHLSRSLSAHAHVALRRRRSSALSFSVTFDHVSFCEASVTTTTLTSSASPLSSSTGAGGVGNSSLGFLREFTQTQSFSGFINDSVMGRVSHTTTFPQLELFHHCVHLFHEIEDSKAAAEAIALLFERDLTAIETLVLALPLNIEASDSVIVDQRGSRSPVRSPIKSASASPAKRASKTRQLEMRICGAVPELPELSSALASLDSDLLLQVEAPGELDAVLPDSIGIVTLHSPPRSPSPSSTSSVSSRATVSMATCRSESLSSSGSVAEEDYTSARLYTNDKTKHSGNPEDAIEDALLTELSTLS